jgi:hypothetical protein
MVPNSDAHTRVAFSNIDRNSVVNRGLDSQFAGEAVAHHMKLLKWMDEALAPGPYLAGDGYSNAEAAVIPYILRLDPHCSPLSLSRSRSSAPPQSRSRVGLATQSRRSTCRRPCSALGVSVIHHSPRAKTTPIQKKRF